MHLALFFRRSNVMHNVMHLRKQLREDATDHLYLTKNSPNQLDITLLHALEMIQAKSAMLRSDAFRIAKAEYNASCKQPGSVDPPVHNLNVYITTDIFDTALMRDLTRSARGFVAKAPDEPEAPLMALLGRSEPRILSAQEVRAPMNVTALV